MTVGIQEMARMGRTKKSDAIITLRGA